LLSIPFIGFKEDSIVVKGGNVTIKDLLKSAEVFEIPKYDEVEGIPVPNKDLVYAIYNVEIPEITGLELEDVVTIMFGRTLRFAGSVLGTVEVAKDITIRTVKLPEKEITGRYSATFVTRVAKLFDTAGMLMVLAVKEDDKLITGPIVIGNRYDNYTVAFWINSMV